MIFDRRTIGKSTKPEIHILFAVRFKIKKAPARMDEAKLPYLLGRVTFLKFAFLLNTIDLIIYLLGMWQQVDDIKH
jgi:hypothetical protein